MKIASIASAIAVCLSILALPGRTAAQEPAAVAQEIITRQIEAFLNDDATSAYSFASPSIREKFPDEASFFEMVKRGYAPVYRPGNFGFGRSKVSGDVILQEVLISGSGGKHWTAIYQLMRQPDGSYKINGVHMTPSKGGSDI
ncbi:uncharacterized protein DUF4864 [Rhizobium subbaraonis]|uniref:Uncharacterized protein DUF4864 n=1 Tax=Rhizobium subbaraonis TaxID=908946 RepID=A0A285UA57_9HYPH|nr:DUF4864 domain-containing protein [Rhizobium subbaraonis]SOC38689.1 uncharacterized protein DUF4864 [Rhizobium subbaraonis]